MATDATFAIDDGDDNDDNDDNHNVDEKTTKINLLRGRLARPLVVSSGFKAQRVWLSFFSADQ